MKRIDRTRCMSVAVAILAAAALCGCASARLRRNIQNPYAGVNWEKCQQHKASFHVHTAAGDGKETPDRVIDRYADLGYTILALTDHDTHTQSATTWPWKTFNRDPASLGMVAIEGNEISAVHHTGSYFNDYGDANAPSEEVVLDEIGRRGGLAMLFHPGRYPKPVEWYVDRYRSCPHLVGLEIFNQGDRYPGDRRTWDAILGAIIAERPVWGFSNDDMHDPATQLGRNWNMLLLPDLSERSVRKAMEKGTFFYVYACEGHKGKAPPSIQSIQVDSRKGTIRLRATDYGRIEWVSGGDIVHQGEFIELSGMSSTGGYVRAVVYGADGQSVVGTQPFRIQAR